MQKAPAPIHTAPPLPVRLFQAAAVFFLVGWAGSALLVMFTLPFLFPRWLFFFSLFLAFTGTAVPVVWYLNRRFAGERFPSEGILLREALECAALADFLVWLQAGRMFTAFLGWAFFAAFLAVEILLRIYEYSRWSPAKPGTFPADPPVTDPVSPTDDGYFSTDNTSR